MNGELVAALEAERLTGMPRWNIYDGGPAPSRAEMARARSRLATVTPITRNTHIKADQNAR